MTQNAMTARNITNNEPISEYYKKAARLANEYVRIFGDDTDPKGTKEIKDYVKDHLGFRSDFQPTDLCYNSTSLPLEKGTHFKDNPHVLEKTARGKFIIRGENYPYSGVIYRTQSGKGGKTIKVGRWENGELAEWDEEAYRSRP